MTKSTTTKNRVTYALLNGFCINALVIALVYPIISIFVRDGSWNELFTNSGFIKEYLLIVVAVGILGGIRHYFSWNKVTSQNK